MMPPRYTVQSSAPRLSQWRLLLQGMCWAGSLSLLSSGVSLAQIADPAASVPSAQDLLAPVAPAAPAPEPAVRPEPVRPEVARPEPVRSQPVRSQVAEPRQRQPEPVVVQTAPPASRPSAPAAAAPRPVPSANTYIDTTDYSLGATQSDDQRPNSIVLSERSTGCQFVLQRGQRVPGSVCASRRVPVATTATRQGGIPILASRAAARSVRSVRSVNIRPQHGGHANASIARSTPANRFYNLTVRPPGRIGNNNTAIIFPLSIPAAITSAFGWRVHPISGATRFHSGTDIGAPMGTPVLAAYAGQVAIANAMRGYGLTVVLNHDPSARDREGYRQTTAETLYAHMSELFVQPGQWVEQGEVIGRVGSTGNSTGPHLHFEYRQLTDQGWQALNPGEMLEYSLAQLVQSLQTAQARPTSNRG